MNTAPNKPNPSPTVLPNIKLKTPNIPVTNPPVHPKEMLRLNNKTMASGLVSILRVMLRKLIITIDKHINKIERPGWKPLKAELIIVPTYNPTIIIIKTRVEEPFFAKLKINQARHSPETNKIKLAKDDVTIPAMMSANFLRFV
ncbi:hypothetical protein [Laspinema palackyanum]|uniref:hypothetical protein n=1 Tax=Laspinema palackyanum TaxID=3231601 RepID=UPI00349F459D